MKLRAAILLALSTLSLSLVVLVSPAAPAWACSCALGSKQQKERADLIVVGTVTQVSDDSVQLAVESVEKGSLTAGGTIGLRVGREEASCGYGFRVGSRYRVNSLDGATGLCAGIRRLRAAPFTAAPSEPAPSESAPSDPGPSTVVSSEPASPAVAQPMAASAAATTPSRWWLAGGAMLVVLAGLTALAVRRRRAG